MGNRLSEEKVTRIINNAGGAVGSVKEQYAAAYGEERPGTRQNLPAPAPQQASGKTDQILQQIRTTRGETAAPAWWYTTTPAAARLSRARNSEDSVNGIYARALQIGV